MEEELKKLFLELVQFSKNVSPEIWMILVKQQLVWAVSSLIALLSTGIIGVWGLTVLKRRPKWALDQYNTNVIGGGIAGIAGGLFLIAVFLFLVEGFPRLFNPEYFALMAIKP
jgi:hypothetical protein